MFRFICILLFLIIFFALSIPLYIIEWILGKCNVKARDKSSKFIIKYAFKICLFISGVKIDARGTENIPADKACLFVGNHNGFFDILTTYVTIPQEVGYVAKKEMLKIPFLSWWMINISCLFLDRQSIKAALKTILQGTEQLKRGVSVFIFPEGTRSKDGKMKPFKEGSLKMAEKAKCPVVPVAISGTAELFEQHLPRITKGVVIVEYGKPIIIDELEKEDKKFLGAYTQNKIQEMLDRR
jgi:1-acyl-sn-glycerol-3-phosphate acyltransferase